MVRGLHLERFGTRTASANRGLKLADPDYLAADPVELLLGADVYAHILRSGLRRGRDQEPVAQFTNLGWILLGGLRTGPSVPAMTTLHCSQDDNLSSVLQRFWEWEEPSRAEVPFTTEDQKCEELFVSSTKRLPDGRFQVRLPFNIQPTPQLASTKHAAARMLSAMSRRFALDDGFRLKYKEFMEEYLALRHMTPAPPAPSPVEGRLCYLPHHGVLKSAEGNVKLRVVFNGSARTSTGISLNSCLFAGPNLMSSLPDIILRWRRHRYAFVADIEKMYRQIVVHPDDRDLQRILWELNGTVSEFQLNTVTYGTACAPFLAVRVLHQLANDEEEKFPAGAAALRHDCYVDDILSGASSLAAGRQLQSELTAVCMAGGFPLRKWAANHPDLLEGVPSSHRLAASGVSDLPHEEHAVLGVRWSPPDDCLMMATTIMADPVPTKRSLLSRVARLFDPLGWLAPVVVLTKMLIQTTWLQQLEWDTPLAPTEATTWINILDDLPVLAAVKIPRWFIGFTPEGNVELHGFADASERAYGAVIYLRTVQNGKISVSLVQAKTRVAPLKRVSLPRLELCAAALLAKLSAHVKMVLGLQAVPTFHWSDSTVTLAWIRGHPTKWATFVANRVAEIQRQSDAVRWCHVPGTENPADCASRGLMPRELATHPLWWQGPPFLRSESASWPKMEDPLQGADVPEQRSKRCYAVKLETVEPTELTRFSDLRRLLRVTAWILRWRSRRSAEKISTVATDALVLLPQELEAALLQWVRITQRIAFPRELEDVRAGRAVHGRSALRKLTPFIDKDGILRVGGRIKHALLNADQKHPIILATQSHLSQLIVEAHHRRTLHGGTQTTLASIRQRYWLLRGRQNKWSAITPPLPSSQPFVASSHVAESPPPCTATAGQILWGADKELRALFLSAGPEARRIAGHLADRGVRWVFNPPAAPHFGGLWEAAVRSVKHHLRRVIDDAALTYEEMTTLLAEVEACLNSRPLQPITDDPEDTSALTPGHFLVGEPLLAIPEASLVKVAPNRLTRWRLLQQMRDHLWARWSQEYIQSLTPRLKWWKAIGGLKEGQLCLIKDEGTSPTRWPLARVVRLHQGQDAQARVADVKTASGNFTRPTVKLIPLPDTSTPDIFLPNVRDATEPSDFRPITIPSGMTRCLHKILAARASASVEIDDRQRAFRPTDGYRDNTFLLELILKYHHKWFRNIYMALHDVQKAFDSVSHIGLTNVMRTVGCPKEFVKYVINTYKDGTTVLEGNGWRSAPILRGNGVKQGDHLS
ncbi:uncharacterized protein LOC143266093 [Megachile rotundata]|uniref:uncharacterized protein LOC143266093 n=1 Tax=Megachile rotundata TaxID=143995 RepID=UPI003FCF6C7D